MKRTTKKKYTPRTVYTPVELLDHEIADLRVDYASAINPAAIASVGYTREVAHSVASKLGHIPLRQGASVECSKCGASGSARTLLDGDVFTFPCGVANYFGKESTKEQREARARWEYSRAREVEATATIGREAIAAAHRRTGDAYAALVAEGFHFTCKHCKRAIRALALDEGGYVDAIDGSANCTDAPNHEAVTP